MKVISGGITKPKGFKAAGLHCGIKRRKLDLGLLFSDYSAVSAGVFTTNKLRAPHIKIDKDHIKKSKIQAVLVNSGNANCYNGKRGSMDALFLIKKLSEVLKIRKESVLLASTGVIGKLLPVSSMIMKMPMLKEKLNLDSKNDFASAILTTDKKIKQLAIKVKIGGKDVVIAGCAKGSGMIHPNMATTLTFITTDAKITKKALNKALKIGVDNSFNLISVDGDMSPNDSLIVLANGQAKNKTIDLNSKSLSVFIRALNFVLLKLSRMLIEDAEGSTKILKVDIKGAKTLKDAKILAFAIANSKLVKTAAYGEDANWGRVVSSVGLSGVYLKPEKLELSFGGIKIFKDLKPIRYNEKRLQKIFKKPEILITVNLNIGTKSVTVLSCDLTKEYVAINANYRT